MTDIKSAPHELKEAELKVVKELERSRDSAYERFPLLFTMLAAFGLVATFYGFEHMIDSIPFLANNPLVLLGVGVGSLVITGTLYKKLG